MVTMRTALSYGLRRDEKLQCPLRYGQAALRHCSFSSLLEPYESAVLMVTMRGRGLLEDGRQSNLLRTFGLIELSATRCAQSSRAPDINTEAGYQGLLTRFLSTASCVAFTRIRQASGRLNSDLGQPARWQAIRSRMCYSDLRAMPPQAGALPSLLIAPQRRRTEVGAASEASDAAPSDVAAAR